MSLRILYIKLSQASILLPVIAGIVYYKQLTLPYRVLFYFFLLSIGFEVQASIIGKLYHNNMPGLHLFTALEFLVFSFIYYSFFRTNRVISLLILINTILFIIAAFADALFVHSIWTVNTLARSYSALSMLSYTLIYFYFMFSKDDEYYSSRHPMFWLNAGVLIYFGSNTLYFLFNKDLLHRSPVTETIGLYTHAALNIFANYLYARSFRCFRQTVL